jgi:antitoxin (DNA-binding transcriptional repressor) of toxin-antitoxin stability system
MKTIGLFDAKRELPTLLDEVEMGARVALTRQGRRVARLEPWEGPRDNNLGLEAGRDGSPRSPDEIAAILAEFREFRGAHRGALRGLSIRELIDDGRKH